MTTKVLIIDDSPLIRRILNEILSSDPNLEVVAEAADPYEARELIKKHNPDVITLDIQMPKMNGITFLKNLMKLHPLPVVMISSLTQKGAEETIVALELGAIDFVPKPAMNKSLSSVANEIISKVKSAANKKPHLLEKKEHKKITEQINADHLYTKVVAIGASTGGIEALNVLLEEIPMNFPPIVITQHIPPIFSASLASRLDNKLPLNVVEAQDGMILTPGYVYVAPGDKHLSIQKIKANQYKCCVSSNEAPKVSGHRPSVDVLFESIADSVGSNAIIVILTGMGSDGTKGLKKIKSLHPKTYSIGQSENSCVVYGMPGAAFKAGVIDEQVDLQEIAGRLISLLK